MVWWFWPLLCCALILIVAVTVLLASVIAGAGLGDEVVALSGQHGITLGLSSSPGMSGG